LSLDLAKKWRTPRLVPKKFVPLDSGAEVLRGNFDVLVILVTVSAAEFRKKSSDALSETKEDLERVVYSCRFRVLNELICKYSRNNVAC
jgi:hypothetical protein